MSRHAFFIVGDRIVHIANASGAGFQYHGQEHVLAPRAKIAPQRHDHAETVLLVERGTLDVMINGFESAMGAGSFVRIPANTWFAYANLGSGPVHFLCRTAPVPAMRDGIRVTIALTAA